MKLQRRLCGVYTICIPYIFDTFQLQTCFFLFQIIQEQLIFSGDFQQHEEAIKRLYSKTKTYFKLGMVIFSEFQVVFTVLSCMGIGNPVYDHLLKDKT